MKIICDTKAEARLHVHALSAMDTVRFGLNTQPRGHLEAAVHTYNYLDFRSPQELSSTFLPSLSFSLSIDYLPSLLTTPT